MASIRDVARRAVVSTATVSHVLNGTRYVSPELTERVMAVVNELNYRPDAVARSLRRRETLTIGLLVPSIEIPFFASTAYHVERTAFEHGYNLILCNSNWEQGEDRQLLQDLIARRVDGLIVISATMEATEISPVLEAGIPVVMFEREMADLDLDAVGIDNHAGAREATEHLLELGHRRIGVILGKKISTVSDQRLEGFCERMESAGLGADRALMFRGDYWPETGRKATQHFLDLAERPTAIFAFNDLMAIGVIQALTEQGIRVPQDISVIGFDDIPLAQYSTPALTTVHQPLSKMGEKAVELLLQRIDGGEEAARFVRLDPELVVRASTAPSPA